MACEKIQFADGNFAIVCGVRRPKRYCSCGKPADFLCDFPLSGKKAGKTCDKPVCKTCRLHISPDKDYCRVHAAMAETLNAQGTLNLEQSS